MSADLTPESQMRIHGVDVEITVSVKSGQARGVSYEQFYMPCDVDGFGDTVARKTCETAKRLLVEALFDSAGYGAR